MIKKFYFGGFLIFTIIGMSNIYTLLKVWYVTIISQKISSIAGICFNFLLAIFFFHLYTQLTKTSAPILKPEEIEGALEIIPDGQIHNNKSRNR